MPKTSDEAKKKKDKDDTGEISTVKGMRDLYDNEVFRYRGFEEKAAETALYYGFKPIETPIVEKEALFSRTVGEESDIVNKEMYTFKSKGGDKLALRPEFTASMMRAYIENGMRSLPQPVYLYSFGPLFRHERPQKGRYRQFYQFNLEIIGSSKSILDAMIINVTYMILKDAGLENLNIEVNSIGDKDHRENFKKDLTNYYRKNVKDLCTNCKERLKTNPLRLLDCKEAECQPIKAGAPDSIAYLTGEAKEHFKQVIEYLDTMAIPYSINSHLVRGLDYYSRTVFEITNTAPVAEGEEGGEEKIVVKPQAIAGGGRYDYLARHLGNKKDISAVGAAIGVDRVIEMPDYANHKPRLVKKPKIFFIQLSFDAKLKSFAVIEALREARVPIAQSLSKDSIGQQLAIAEKMKVPYTIILGQKEALENSVIVRNMETRSQNTVKIDKLGDFLKKMK